MTPHLTPDECLAAADGVLDETRQRHVDGCAACRQDIDAATTFLRDLAAAPVPEPSPLFWSHFSQRVSEATAGSRHSWWIRLVRPALTLGAATAAVVLALWLVREPPATPATPDPNATTAATSLSPEPVAWDSVVVMTTDWSSDDLEQLTAGFGDGLMIEDLTAEERTAFAELLRNELGVVQ